VRTLLRLLLILLAVVVLFYLVLAPMMMVLSIALPNFLKATSHPMAMGAFHPSRLGVGLMSMPVMIVLMVFVFAFAVIVLKMIVRGGNGGHSPMEADETRMMQEIYHGLSRMEKRVEALETILLERARKDKH